jgi:hypothetical protein
MNTAELKCPKCSKPFKSEAALRMHDMRVHTGQIKTPGQLALVRGPKQQMQFKPLKKTAILAAAEAEAPKKGRRKGGVFPSWTQDQVDLLFAIESQYKAGRHVQWEQAFRDHPEWRQDLGDRSNMALAGKLIYMKQQTAKKAAKEGKSTAVDIIETRPRLGRPKKISSEVAAHDGSGNGNDVKPPTVAFCPNCGEHIKLWNDVAGIVDAVPKRQRQR